MLQGYEGEGGLHALLHGRGWVTSLSAGPAVSGSDFTLFRLTMTLTEEGERHTDEIVELCHRFLAVLREEPPQKRIQVCVFDVCFVVVRTREFESLTGVANMRSGFVLGRRLIGSMPF